MLAPRARLERATTRLTAESSAELSYLGWGRTGASLDPIQVRVTTDPLCEMHGNPQYHFVYCIYDAAMTPLYVGCTSDLGRRIREHMRKKTWGTQITAVDAIKYGDKGTALSEEWHAISALMPLHNDRKREMPWFARTTTA